MIAKVVTKPVGFFFGGGSQLHEKNVLSKLIALQTSNEFHTVLLNKYYLGCGSGQGPLALRAAGKGLHGSVEYLHLNSSRVGLCFKNPFFL